MLCGSTKNWQIDGRRYYIRYLISLIVILHLLAWTGDFLIKLLFHKKICSRLAKNKMVSIFHKLIKSQSNSDFVFCFNSVAKVLKWVRNERVFPFALCLTFTRFIF